MTPRMSSSSSSGQRSLFRDSNEDRKKREFATLLQMSDVTSEYLKKMETNSRFFFGDGRKNVGDGNRMNDGSSETKGNNNRLYETEEICNSKSCGSNSAGIIVPRFQPTEIVLETTIGMGEFGVVLKIGSIVLNTTGSSSNHHQGSEKHPAGISSDDPLLWLSSEQQNHVDDVETDRILRNELAMTCRRSQSHDPTATASTSSSSSSDNNSYDDSFYSPQASASTDIAPFPSSDVPDNVMLVIKQIRKDLYTKRRIEAAKDLAREAKLLARLQQLYFFDGQHSEQYPYHHHNNTAHRNNHPNIISLRGIVSNPGTPQFGIILDRLHLTLQELSTSWNQRQKLILEKLATSSSRKHRGAFPDEFMVTLFQKVGGWFKGESHEASPDDCSVSVVSETDPSEEEAARTNRASPEALLLLGERILALWDVSEGMAHLHHHTILYRDLKTENVGRTVRSRTEVDNNNNSNGQSPFFQNFDHREQRRMQIFDFGLAKECKPSYRISQQSTETESEDAGSFYDNYKMTGMTGTMRIMAPEVIKCRPYGLPADVYSFGICMWEVFSGTKFNFLSAAEICDTKLVVRPKLPVVFDTTTEDGSVGMPKKLQKLMQQCWHEDPGKRPNFRQISKTLRSILAVLHRQSLRPHHHLQQQQHYHQHQPLLRDPSFSFLSEASDGRNQPIVSPWRSCFSGNDAGEFWNKIQKAHKQKKQQHHSTRGGGGRLDNNNSTASPTDLLSDQAEFWSRLEAIRASGLLDD